MPHMSTDQLGPWHTRCHTRCKMLSSCGSSAQSPRCTQESARGSPASAVSAKYCRLKQLRCAVGMHSAMTAGLGISRSRLATATAVSLPAWHLAAAQCATMTRSVPASRALFCTLRRCFTEQSVASICILHVAELLPNTFSSGLEVVSRTAALQVLLQCTTQVLHLTQHDAKTSARLQSSLMDSFVDDSKTAKW